MRKGNGRYHKVTRRYISTICGAGAPGPLISKISNGHISATGDPIHFVFGSWVGYFGTAYLMSLFPVRPNQIE